VRLLKDEEIKFSADGFFSEQNFLQKLVNIRLVQDLFVITKATFYENFKALRLKLNEQRANKKRAFVKRYFLFFFY